MTLKTSREPSPPMLVDFETQSEVHISDPLYTCHESTKVLCMSWGLQGAKKGNLWFAGTPVPQEIIDHVAAYKTIGASNARFDREIWNNIAVPDNGFPETNPNRWFCTQAQSRIAGLPSKLDDAARAAGIKHRKDKRGTQLIGKCCVPPYSQDPQDYADLGDYCLQDWVVMNELAVSLGRITAWELVDYQRNEEMNDRGIKIDRALATAAQSYAEVEREEINAQLSDVTCDFVERCTQHQRVCKWLRECLEDDGNDAAIKLMTRYKTDKDTGETVKKYSSDKTVRANMLAANKSGDIELSGDVKEVLQLMDDAGGSAVAKFGKMCAMADPDDDRVRGAIRYAGAPSTLRFSSIGMQIHNFRRDAFKPEVAEHYRAQMLDGVDLTDPEGNPVRIMDTLGRLLRSAIIPEEGKVLVVGDWSAIESRMNAYLSGEEDKLEVFRTGGDPYCYAAEGIYGRVIDAEKDPDERQVGKVSDLACGFLGGVGALAAMAEQYRIYIDPEKRQDIVDSYRAKHPATVSFADGLQGAAQRAVLNPDTWVEHRNVAYLYDTFDNALYCELPDHKTQLRYPACRFDMKPVPWDETELRPQLTALKAAVKPAADAKEWTRHGLWRGIFIENVVQASCACFLRECRIAIEDAGYPPIFDVHDEIVLEVDKADAENAAYMLKTIMETPPTWAKGIPLKVEPEIMARYGK